MDELEKSRQASCHNSRGKQNRRSNARAFGPAARGEGASASASESTRAPFTASRTPAHGDQGSGFFVGERNRGFRCHLCRSLARSGGDGDLVRSFFFLFFSLLRGREQ